MDSIHDLLKVQRLPVSEIFTGVVVVVSNLAVQDGESNWFEGAMFLAVYAILAIIFRVHP